MSQPVAVLGATGTVGQKMIAMIQQHTDFHVAEVAASERSAGKLYAEKVLWKEPLPLSKNVKKLTLKNLKDVQSPYVISALPADIAKEVEPYLAARGHHIFSNASAFRMDPNVPLLMPEINTDHLSLLSQQTTLGKIITNPNCATVFITLGLAPLKELGTIEHVAITTLQAISGAGYPGVPAMDILGNSIPNIGGAEEVKIEEETKKILGTPEKPAEFSLSVHVNRVPVQHGHSTILHVFFKESVSAQDAQALFQARAQHAPAVYCYHHQDFRPQPLYDLHAYDQRAHIGRVKQGGRPHVVGLVSMGHNLVRGAAGAALLNMEKVLPHLG